MMYDFTPRTFRILAGFLYATAALVLLRAVLGLVLLAMGDGPDWNVVECFSEACGWFYVGALHSMVARYKEAAQNGTETALGATNAPSRVSPVIREGESA